MNILICHDQDRDYLEDDDDCDRDYEDEDNDDDNHEGLDTYCCCFDGFTIMTMRKMGTILIDHQR